MSKTKKKDGEIRIPWFAGLDDADSVFQGKARGSAWTELVTERKC
jgi:hypothetical protein